MLHRYSAIPSSFGKTIVILQHRHSATLSFGMTRSRRILIFEIISREYFLLTNQNTCFCIIIIFLYVNMADDFHITRAFNLLQEATVLLSGGIESSSRDSININENANEIHAVLQVIPPS